MSLITKDDLKSELEIASNDTDNDTLLEILAEAIQDLFDDLTSRTWEETTHTEYHNSDEYGDMIFLRNYPVTSITSIHDDPERDFGATDLVDSDDYTYDADKGIVYYDGWFYKGKQSLKVVYKAGYTANALPKHIKQTLVRQACHWFTQAVKRRWDVSSITLEGGGGTTSYKDLRDNLLPDFVMLAERNRRISYD